MNNSRFIADGQFSNARSRLIKAVQKGVDGLESFELKPQGVFGSEAKIVCGAVTLKSSELDLEFTVKFDDDMEQNEAEIIVYNLSKNTISQLKQNSKISIEAGYKGDTGIVFSGYVKSVKNERDSADKFTTIKCIDDIADHTISEVTFAAGSKASYILKESLKKTGAERK